MSGPGEQAAPPPSGAPADPESESESVPAPPARADGPSGGADPAGRSGSAGPSPPAFADKLNYLFAHVYPRGGRERSNEEVVRLIADRGGPTISATYLYYLRTGQRDNPTKRHLEVLAEAFGVSPAYFFDDALAERVQAELGLLSSLRDSPVLDIQRRSAGVSAGMLRALSVMLDQVRELEHLPPVQDPPPEPGPARPRRRRGRPDDSPQ